MKYYKLLTQEMTSYKDTQWEIGVPISISKPGNAMCTDQVLHCYNHPLLASFLNTVHANIKNPRLFLIEVDSIVNNDGLKFASKSQTLLEEIPYIDIPLLKRIEIAIKIAKTMHKEEEWSLWADRWLSGEDRSKESAYAAAYATYPATHYPATKAAITAVCAAAYDAVGASVNAALTAVNAGALTGDYVDKIEFNKILIDIIEETVYN